MAFPTRAALLALVLGGCSAVPLEPPAGVPDPTPFSLATPGQALPVGWEPYKLMRLKKPTEYRVVSDDGRVVVQAEANGSASGLRYGVSIDPVSRPWIEWAWKVGRNIEGSRNSEDYIEDAPARVIVSFAGSREDLPPDEQINYDLALTMSGYRMPFATLMYVWDSALPPGTIVTHHFTSRVKMIVAGSRDKALGAWHRERHNLLADYRRAFGAEPPRISWVAIMSDSDNTNSRAVAYFSDIHFRSE